MERLKSVYLLAFIALAAMPAAGQQTAPHNPSTDAEAVVAVVGDIANCNTYPVPTDTILTVRQAVINAGLVSESVNVMVIHSTQERPQWTQSVSATSADNGEPVESGDVLVVQSMSPLTAAVRKNAALRSDFGVTVVGLEQDGIVIGDVLHATNTLPPADGQLKVICRFSGQKPISEAQLYHPIVHGDVISISRSTRTVLQGFGSMLPAFSERKSGGTAVTRDPLMLIPVQDGESREADAAVSDDEEEIPPIVVPALPISQADDVADAGATDNKTSFAGESMDVAPIAPSEMEMEMEMVAGTNPATTAFNPWNLVFMGGLLLAGTLILAGTLKPEPDDDSKSGNPASTIIASDPRHAAATAASHRKWTEAPRPIGTAVPVSQTAETPTKFEQTIRTPSEARAAKDLVGGHEWFSGDWHGQIVSCKLPCQGEAAADDSVPESCDTNHIHVAIEATNEYSDAVSETGSVKAVLSDERSLSDIEDLLQNRLPIDLCETQLQLRGALFGKPKGPRSLRIDAGHAAIPAPHMTLSRDKRREQTAAATNAAAAHSAATHTPSVAESSGSLDRALHFLQERTGS